MFYKGAVRILPDYITSCSGHMNDAPKYMLHIFNPLSCFRQSKPTTAQYSTWLSSACSCNTVKSQLSLIWLLYKSTSIWVDCFIRTRHDTLHWSQPCASSDIVPKNWQLTQNPLIYNRGALVDTFNLHYFVLNCKQYIVDFPSVKYFLCSPLAFSTRRLSLLISVSYNKKTSQMLTAHLDQKTANIISLFNLLWQYWSSVAMQCKCNAATLYQHTSLHLMLVNPLVILIEVTTLSSEQPNTAL